MKKLQKIVAAIAVLGMLGAAGSVYAAATGRTPAEIAAGLTGKTVADLVKERAAGKSYGAIAKDAGKLEEFQAQMLEEKKAILDQRVKDGILTQAQADEVYNAIKDNQANCDGTGTARLGRGYGAGFGQGGGRGRGMGLGRGAMGSNCPAYGAGLGLGGGR